MNPPDLAKALDFSDKVVLITGGNRGIGAGLVKRFAQAGAAVALSCRQDVDSAQKLVAEIQADGGKAWAGQADVSLAADVERLVERTVSTFGRLDVLINNAGIYPVSPLLEMAQSEWKAVVAANLTGTHLCTQQAARVMVEQPRLDSDPGSAGTIINISSIEAQATAYLHSHYTAAKAGVEHYTRSAALELAASHIRVNCVAPGLIDRPGLAQDWPDGVQRWLQRVPLGRLGRPDDIADACLFLASPLARWITGVSLVVDGGILVTPAF